MEPVKSWTLSVKTVESLMNYLVSRPYMEVAHLITEVGKELQAQSQNSSPAKVLDLASGDANGQKSQESA